MTTTHRSHDMTDKLREAIEALPRYDMDQSGESSWMGQSPDGDYLQRDNVLAALAAAPQPAPVDREALVEVMQGAVLINRYAAEAIADALLARGLRLPGGDETMAWAVLGEDGKMVAINYDRMTAQHLCNPGERIERVAIRVVEGGDDE